jgi:ribosome-associated protein
MSKIEATLKRVYAAIDNKKGDEIVVLDVSQISSFTDYFVLCQGYNQKQNQAICDEVVSVLKKEEQLVPSHIEGYQEGEWILLDYFGFVVHIFSQKARQFYKLEKLWGDAVALQTELLRA